MVAMLSNTDAVRSTPPCSPPTIGVEEEFILVDPHTGAPFLGNCEVASIGCTLGAHLQLELSRCQIETATPPCGHLTDVMKERGLAPRGSFRARMLGVSTLFHDEGGP